MERARVYIVTPARGSDSIIMQVYSRDLFVRMTEADAGQPSALVRSLVLGRPMWRGVLMQI